MVPGPGPAAGRGREQEQRQDLDRARHQGEPVGLLRGGPAARHPLRRLGRGQLPLLARHQPHQPLHRPGAAAAGHARCDEQRHRDDLPSRHAAHTPVRSLLPLPFVLPCCALRCASCCLRCCWCCLLRCSPSRVLLPRGCGAAMMSIAVPSPFGETAAVRRARRCQAVSPPDGAVLSPDPCLLCAVLPARQPGATGV
ncbi:hypothetical protein VR45_23285 [Streptomyces sp. NRRL S-495]|nr:hypothetical protein VR45_23285 [Streptomyces sp. NRRL S-495]